MTAIEIIAVRKGSFAIDLGLRRPQGLLPGFDVGEEGIRKLTLGIGDLTEDSPLPEGFDHSVLMALRDAGRIIDRGVETVHVRPSLRLLRKHVAYNQKTRERIVAHIRKMEQTWATVEGRLLMADVDESVLKCRLRPTIGDPIICSFDEDLTQLVSRSLRQFVQVRGDAKVDTTSNRILSLVIKDLEQIDEPTGVPSDLGMSAFWQPKHFEQLVAEQGVYPVVDWGRLTGDWPSDTDFDEFLRRVREAAAE